MARVLVDIQETTLDNDHGHEVPSVCGVCTRCDHHTESFGTSTASVKRCLVLMREECPNGERNFYVDVLEE